MGLTKVQMWTGHSKHFNPNNYHGFFLQHCLLCHNMAPNQFIQCITKTVWGSSQHHCPAGCKHMFQSRGRLIKHLRAAHPTLMFTKFCHIPIVTVPNLVYVQKTSLHHHLSLTLYHPSQCLWCAKKTLPIQILLHQRFFIE